jgi:hypothetical protein
MGFRKPNFPEAYSTIRTALTEIRSPYNDGFTAAGCKEELYQLKCWLDDQYESLPHFVGEEEWEQKRIIQLLKR